MQTIALIAQKGGTGKTTLAISLAVAAVRDGKAALIIDLDPQASACKWGDRRNADAPLIVDAQPSRLANALMKAEQAGVDVAIIDTPARVEQAAAEASRLADLVLIPCKPSIYDIETVSTSFELTRGRAKRPPLVVLNAVPAHGTRHEQAAQAIRSLGLILAPAIIGNRVAFEYAAQLGQSVSEFEPDGKAASEVQHLYMSICRILDMSTESETEHERQEA
jgi:chromosome partitioning protein